MTSPSPKSPPLQGLIKLGRPFTVRHLNLLLASLLGCGKHYLVTAIFSQALSNSLGITPRTHFLAASALLAAGRSRDAERLISTAPASFGFLPLPRLWDALLRQVCVSERDPSRALELLSVGVRLQGASLLPSTFRMVVSELCAHGDVEGALKVFDLMTQRENGCEAANYACSLIVSRFSKVRKAALALEFYERVRKGVLGFEPNLVTLTAVVDALGREGRIGDALVLMEKMEETGVVADAVLYSSLVCGYLRRGFLMEGFRKHRLMLDKGVIPDVVNFTSMIDGLCKEGSVEKVIGFLYEMERRNVKLNLITYTSIIGGFCKRNKLEGAFAIVRKLEETGVVVDEYVYSILVDGLCKRGDLDRAFSLLQEMENRGIKAGIVTYNAVINGLCKAGDTKKAIEISKDLVADNFTYSTLLHGCIKKGDAAAVIATKDRLENSGIAVDVVTCNVLIKACFMINKVDDAYNLLRTMPDMGLVANSITYCTMIDMMCKLGKIDDALELLDEHMKVSSFSSAEAYNCLIRALCREGKVSMADRIFEDLIQKNLFPDLDIYRKLIRAHFGGGGGEAVVDFVCRMEKLESGLLSLICNEAFVFLSTRDCCGAAMDVYKLLRRRIFTVSSKTYYTLLKSLLRNGIEQLIQPLLSEFMKIHGLNEPRIINLLSCYISKKDVGEAIQFSNYIGCNSVPISVMRKAVCALKKEGEIQDAYNFLKKAEQNGSSLDLSLYSIVVDGLCKGGYLEKALELCESMKMEGFHPNIVIHNSVLHCLCQQGYLTEAFRLLDYLESSHTVPTTITYAILIDALCREGLLDDANQLFQRMPRKGVRPNSRVYNSLISGYCNSGLVEKALELMSHLEEHGLPPDAFTVGAIINGYYLKGDTEGALGFFNEFRSKEIVPDFVGFMGLIKGFYAKGRMEEAREILREMFQCAEVVDLINNAGNQIRAESLVSVLSHACEQGRIHEVVTILNEVGLMYVSSWDSSSYDKLVQLKKRQKVEDSYATRTDSGQLLSPISHEISKNTCHFESSERKMEAMTDITDHSLSMDEHTDMDYQRLLGNSLYDDFNLYYPAIALLCSKGELLKANNAINAMIQNSGQVI